VLCRRGAESARLRVCVCVRACVAVGSPGAAWCGWVCASVDDAMFGVPLRLLWWPRRVPVCLV